MPPSVSLVIINYNGEGFIRDCLHSVLSQSAPAHEVVVVDNNSSDGSVEIVRREFEGQVRLVCPGSNLGFAAACNLGIDSTTGELVGVLNNDLTLHPDWLSAILRHVDPSWAFWASQIRFADRPDQIDSAGDGMAVIGAAYKRGHRQGISEYQDIREVFGPCGAAAVYRRSLLERTGGFDNDFFLVYEDADLNMRARLLGFRCLYVPEAVVYHRVNTSIGTFSHNYVFYGHRNSEFVFWQNMPLTMLLLYLPERCLFNLLSFAYFAWKGRGTSFLAAKWDFLRHLSRVREKRRKVQGARTVDSRALRGWLDRNWLRNRWKSAA